MLLHNVTKMEGTTKMVLQNCALLQKLLVSKHNRVAPNCMECMPNVPYKRLCEHCEIDASHFEK